MTGRVPAVGAFFLGVVVLMTACKATPVGMERAAPLAVTVLHSARQCFPAPPGWTLSWVSNQRDYRALCNRCRGGFVGSLVDAAPVDFSREGVLVVEMGRRPTTGYGFDAAGVSAAVSGQTAVVQVRVVTPAPGGVSAQMVTAPCLLLRMPRKGYKNIRVVDSERVSLGGLTVPVP